MLSWLLTASLSLSLSGCGYTLGRAPPSSPVVSLGGVLAPVAEPGLSEAVERAIADAVARRASVGAGPALSAEVLSAEVRSAAVAGVVQEARLSVRFRLEGGAALTLSAARGFPLASDPESTAALRAAAFEALSAELAAEAIPRLLSGPN